MVEPQLFVILGGGGDLTKRKLLPAFYRLVKENQVSEAHVLGASTNDHDDESYRAWANEALVATGFPEAEVADWCDRRLHYQRIGTDVDSYRLLAKRIGELETAHGLPGNRVFYLALPPRAFPVVIEGLGASGLRRGPGWTRVVVEKPFGRDLASAQDLNAVVHRHFDESQVYRIDHYLGKETVQNLLSFRFSNPLFESAWHRDRVKHVEITVAEDLGIEGRADYYEHAGAIRDMVQNHLTQLLSLVAMELPIDFTADSVRDEKVKVMRAIRPIDRDNVVFGQYQAGAIDGEAVPGYREEEGVEPESNTPTYVGIMLFVETLRWAGVPFFLRTGKRLPKRLTQIAVTFHPAPLCPFHGRHDSCRIDPNVLLITLQPDEGFSLLFDIKAPGEPLRLESWPLDFRYEQAFGPLPTAYQTLLLDVMEGDQTLFVRADEVEESWKVYSPLVADEAIPHRYDAGTWGPTAMDQGLALGGAEWMGR